MKINPFIFRNYDIRGIVEKDLDKEKVEILGKAYGTFLVKRKIFQAVAGKDSRLSGKTYLDSFISGVTSCGVDVINIGEVMTQMMYFAQYRFQTNGGVMITASHNPWNYNGFKLATGYSETTGPNEIAELKSLAENENFVVASTRGKILSADVKEDYFKDIAKRINLKRKYKVVIDSHHGTTGLYNPELFRRLGCEVVERQTNVDGRFPDGTPDPTDAKLMENLAQDVLKNNADVGFAYDGDGDRIGFVDDTGRVLWNDVAVAIFARDLLERFPKSKIVYNTLCTQLVREVIEESGGIPIIWKVGHAFIKEKIAEEGAVFGGELSGHFFFADNFYGHDDGTFASLRILEYLSERNIRLSELIDQFPRYESSPEIKIGCPDDKKKDVIKDLAIRFKRDFPEASITDETVIPGDDGVRADFPDGMMVFRYSQNGPYITVKFEAKDQEVFEKRREYTKKLLHSYPEMIWEDELSVNLDFVK